MVERLGRTPTYTELGVYSVMWSEHCSYKNSIAVLKTLPREGGAVLAEEVRPAGVNSAALRTESLPPGAYVLRLTAGGGVASRPVAVVR